MSSKLTDISGVGSDTAKLLMEQGLTSPSEIAGATIKRLCTVPGIGAIRAGNIIKSAKELLTANTEKATTTTKVVTKPRLITPKATPKPTPKPAIGTPSINLKKPEEEKQMNKKEQDKLKKAKKAAAKKAAKKIAAKKKVAKKAAAKKAMKKAAEKKAAKKVAEKKAVKKAAKKKAAKKAAEKKAAKKSKKGKAKKSKK